MNANHEVIRSVLGGVHPEEREASSLDDVYTALTRAISDVSDLAVLAGRHLPTSLARKAERSLSVLIELRDTVMPAASPDGPF